MHEMYINKYDLININYQCIIVVAQLLPSNEYLLSRYLQVLIPLCFFCVFFFFFFFFFYFPWFNEVDYDAI